MNVLAKVYFYPAITVTGISATTNWYHLLYNNIKSFTFKSRSSAPVEPTREAFNAVRDTLVENKSEKESESCFDHKYNLTNSSIICNSLVNGSLWWTLPWTVCRGYFKGEGADFKILSNIIDHRNMGPYGKNVYYLYGDKSVECHCYEP